MTTTISKYFHYLIFALAFVFPIHMNVMPALIVLTVIGWLIFIPIKHIPSTLYSNMLNFTIFSALFIFYLVSMFYSANVEEGWMKISTSLSLILFPLLVFSTKKSFLPSINNVLNYFVLGCFVSMIICYLYATFNYFFPQIALANKWTDYDYKGYFFWKDRLSPFLHTSYISMFFDISIAILVFNPSAIKINNRFKNLLIVLFSITILLFSSRTGMMVLVALWFFVIRKLIVEKKYKTLLLSLSAALLVFGGLFFGAEQFAKRFSTIFVFFSEKKDESVKNSFLRFEIWPVALKSATENLPLGAGIGDATDVLLEKYKENNLTIEIEKKVNAHNQYIQSAIAAGIFGFFSLLLLLFYPLVKAFNKRDYLYVAFVLIVAFNFFFESMLQTQAGVISFAFLNTFFFTSYLKQE